MPGARLNCASFSLAATCLRMWRAPRPGTFALPGSALLHPGCAGKHDLQWRHFLVLTVLSGSASAMHRSQQAFVHKHFSREVFISPPEVAGTCLNTLSTDMPRKALKRWPRIGRLGRYHNKTQYIHMEEDTDADDRRGTVSVELLRNVHTRQEYSCNHP